MPRSIADPLTSHDVNITGFLNMLDAARQAGAKRFVYAASSSTYGDSQELPKREEKIGNPLSPYAATKMAEAAAQVERAFPGTHASGFGHLGDGNIHFHVRAGTRGGSDWIEREGSDVTRLVNDLVTAAGGSISAEHGIGQMKRDELARLSPERVRHLRAIKAALDPQGIMNPGKLVS